MNDNVYNIEDRRRPVNERPLSDTVSLAMNEFKNFIETRVAMLRSEMREKMANIKFAAPLIIVGALFAATAWLLVTGALVAVLTAAFAGSVWAPFYALLIIGLAYAIVGAGALWMARGRLAKQGLMPERTMKVLREDKVWLETEAKTQL